MLLACKHARHIEDPSYAKQLVSRMSATAFWYPQPRTSLVVYTRSDPYVHLAGRVLDIFCSMESSLQ